MSTVVLLQLYFIIIIHVALIVAVAMYSQSMSSMLISSSRTEGVTTFVVKAVILSSRILVLSDALNCTELLNQIFHLGASLFYSEYVVNKCMGN